MKNINKTLIAIMLFFTSLAFINCSEENSIEENTYLSYEERINKLNILNSKVDLFISQLNEKEKNKTQAKTQSDFLKPIAEDTKTIFKDIGFDEEDLKEITGGEINDDVYAIFGILLSYKHSESSNSSKTNLKKGGDVWYCATEAFGINAATTLVNSLYALYGGEVAAGFAVDAAAAAAFRSAAMKAAGKILTRLGGGFGAVLMAIEFAECMF